MLVWLRPSAAHRAQRVSVVFARRGDDAASRDWEGWRVGNLRPTFEPILWFAKPYKIGATIADNALRHGVGPYNESAFLRYAGRADNVIECGFEAGEAGLHPTQKPVRLMRALIELTTQPDHLVLDPFAGSGSTLVAARSLGRRYIGCEISERFAATIRRRLDDELPG
jgi:site-specific DNA-methyltransferase (adenine-specific)